MLSWDACTCTCSFLLQARAQQRILSNVCVLRDKDCLRFNSSPGYSGCCILCHHLLYVWYDNYYCHYYARFTIYTLHEFKTFPCVVGLQEEAGKFFFFLLTLVLVSLTSASIGFAIGAGISIYGIANILIALSFVMQMVTSLK